MFSDEIQATRSTNWNPPAAASYPNQRKRETANVTTEAVHPTIFTLRTWAFFIAASTTTPASGRNIVHERIDEVILAVGSMSQMNSNAAMTATMPATMTIAYD